MLDTSFSHTTEREKDDGPEKLSRKSTLNQEQLDDVDPFLSRDQNQCESNQTACEANNARVSLMVSVDDETVVKAVYDRVRHLQGKHASFGISKLRMLTPSQKSGQRILHLMMALRYLKAQEEQNGLKKTVKSSSRPSHAMKNSHQRHRSGVCFIHRQAYMKFW